MHPGWAAVCGITAARLASKGFTGPRAAYEGRFGLYRTHLGGNLEQWDVGAATRDLGRVWETERVAIKPFPACQLSIACLDAAIALSSRHRLRPGDIERVEALIPPHAVAIVCEPENDKRRPSSTYAAQFSIQFGVACALIHGRFGLAELERYRDPDILALADRVSYAHDPKTGYPKHFSGELVVTLKNGERLAHREQINRGAADNPVSDAGIVAKYMDNARLAIPEAQAARVRDAILGLDAMADVRSLAAAMKKEDATAVR
jgi:2-methylcitrate dehydratase PrpD